MFGDDAREEGRHEWEKLLKMLEKFLDVFESIRDTQNKRLDVEQQILQELKTMNGAGIPVRGVVVLGQPEPQ